MGDAEAITGGNQEEGMNAFGMILNSNHSSEQKS